MSLFTAVEMAPRDPILGLNEQFNADANPGKVNLGVGVYYDDNGKLPLLQCVQKAEQLMMEAPKPRGYLPIDGIAAYETPATATSSAPATAATNSLPFVRTAFIVLLLPRTRESPHAVREAPPAAPRT